MLPYLTCFTITGFFAWINDYSLRKNRKILILITAIFLILIPAVLAGVRSYTVGTDVNFYVRPSFELARSFNSMQEWFSIYKNPGYITYNFERGFFLLVYLTSRLSSDTHILLFSIALIEGIFVYLSLYKLHRQCNIFIGEIVFLLTQYNAFYNMVRQGLAMSICLFAVSILLSGDHNKYLKFFLWVFVAIQFHSTAAIAILFFIVYISLNDPYKITFIKKISLMVLLAIIIILFIPILQYIAKIGILPVRFLDYLNGGSEYSTAKISVIGLLVYYSSYIVLLFGSKYLKKEKYFFVFVAFMDMILILLANISFYLYRMAMYFLIIRIFLLSQRTLYAPRRSENILDGPNILYMEAIGSVILYFVYFIGIFNWHQTIPYLFMN